MIKPEYNVIGVMSGTSLDGIDLIYATYRFNNSWTFIIHQAETIKYPENWKSILSQLVTKSLGELNKIDEAYSEYLTTVVSQFITKNKIKNIDFIASHGHTALHQPADGITVQIGNHQVLADVLKRKVICDFRVQDVEYGGQGAPLVPIGDRLLFGDYDFCLNLGGFANVSFESNNERIAFDICPVNIVLNHFVSKLDREYDDKGKLASNGTINTDLLNQLNALPFYVQSPPKSLGLEWVKVKIFPLINLYNLECKNILRTFVEHVAIQIAKVLNVQKAAVLVTGGGAYNDFLMCRIKSHSQSHIIIPNHKIVEFKEALVFGFLGILKDGNEINCLKSVTGAIKDHSSGKILLPNA